MIRNFRRSGQEPDPSLMSQGECVPRPATASSPFRRTNAYLKLTTEWMMPHGELAIAAWRLSELATVHGGLPAWNDTQPKPLTAPTMAASTRASHGPLACASADRRPGQFVPAKCLSQTHVQSRTSSTSRSELVPFRRESRSRPGETKDGSPLLAPVREHIEHNRSRPRRVPHMITD